MHLLETRPRQPLTGATLAAVAGIALADRWPAAAGPWLAVLAAGALALFWRPRTLGCWAFTGASFALLHSLNLYHSPGRELARVVGHAPPRGAGGWHRLHGTGEARDVVAPFTCFFRLELESLEVPEALPCGGATVNVTWSGPLPAYGDRVQLTGTMQNVPATRNPGQFEFSEYLHRQGIYAEISVRYAADGQVLAHGQGSRLQAFAYASQHWITDQLEGISKTRRRSRPDRKHGAGLARRHAAGRQGDVSAHWIQTFSEPMCGVITGKCPASTWAFCKSCCNLSRSIMPSATTMVSRSYFIRKGEKL